MSVQDLRKKLKPTPAAGMEAADTELSKKLGRRTGNTSADYVKIDEGKNLFRLFPPHDSEDENGIPNPFAEPMVVCYVPHVYVEKDDNGKEKVDSEGKKITRLSVKSVFNSRIHGPRGKKGEPLIAKDLVEEFIKLTNKRANELYPTDETKRKDFARGVYGVFSQDASKRINGILYRDSWVAYVKKLEGKEDVGKFARLELNKAVKSRINKISAVEAEQDPLGTDPFTDLDEGRALMVIYDKQSDKPQAERKPENYYLTELDSVTEEVELANGRKGKVNRVIPITDEDLEKFAAVDSLAKLYRNVFTRRDFNVQISGLKLLDQQYKMGIFDSEEFQQIAEEISGYWQEREPEATNEGAVSETAEEAEVLTSQSETGDRFSLMEREELKAVIKQKIPGMLITQSVTDEDLRNELRILDVKDNEAFEKTLESTTVVQEEQKAEEAPAPKLTAAERLELLKKQKVEKS